MSGEFQTFADLHAEDWLSLIAVYVCRLFVVGVIAPACFLSVHHKLTETAG